MTKTQCLKATVHEADTLSQPSWAPSDHVGGQVPIASPLFSLTLPASLPSQWTATEHWSSTTYSITKSDQPPTTIISAFNDLTHTHTSRTSPSSDSSSEKPNLALPAQNIRRRMMATEATLAAPVDASVHSDPKLTNDADIDSQNVGPNRAKLNGSPAVDDLENKHITGVEDQLNSADVSVSGGSDTEASRAARDGEKGHGRTSSAVKKPATFKAVSVNKTFLASKGPTVSSATKPGEKTNSTSILSSSPSGTSTLSSRPRLVAKSGTGTGSSPGLKAAANGAKPAAGPDPSAVWNKNRPVPTPEPKKLTDEELKKYGIHMASRLAPESGQSAQGNWADIEDDDDDWAPETITWTDGTKTTLPHPDEVPAPPPPPEPTPAPPKEKVLEKPKSPVPPPRTTASPSIKTGGLASGKGLILKAGSAEKPTLVAKPPAPPTPVKSPWAPLPPVEKAPPPVIAAPPAPQQGARYPPRDHATNNNVPPYHAKEIAADDFNRSAWREGGPPGGNRELFNSQSGRYEPVPADRRGSFRSDVHPRQPAVLQRPSQSDHPEPSAAFQTSRNSVPDGPMGRRRGSSVASGGSGSYLQRPGKGHELPGPPQDLLSARRGSMAGSVESPMSPRNFSPSGLQHGPRMHGNQQWQPRPSPGTNHATLHSAGPQTDGRPAPPPPMARLEEDLEMQKKVMREKRELAMQRRREEEAREEAARKARIAAKLEAMGPAPERKSDKKEASPESSNAAPAQAQSRQDGSTGQEAGSQPPAAGPDTSAVPSTPANAKDKPYGERPVTAGGEHARRPSGSEARQPNSWVAPTPQQERLPTWGAAAAGPQAPRNVWGSPNNDRGLGNGTFNTDLGRLPEPQAAGKGPAPIAPPSAQRAQVQIPPVTQARPTTGNAREVNEMRNRWAHSVLEGDKIVLDEKRSQRLERDRSLVERGLTIEQAQATIKDTWRPSGDGRRDPAHVIHHDVRAAGSVDHSSVLPPTGPSAATQSRSSSRFFPPRDNRHDSTASHAEPSRPNSPSPPPPDMLGHPAFDGDAMHPHVSLPRPHPVVKLPPSAAAAQSAAPRSTGPFAWATPAGYKDGPGTHGRGPHQQNHVSQRSQDSAGNENWQDRINNLLTGRKPNSPPKAPGVEPVTKSALDYSGHYNPATVSLPRSATQNVSDDVKSFTTKPPAEECFEEQEMGSLPRIHLPHKTPEAAWQPAAAPIKPLPRRFWVSDVETVRSLWFPHEMSTSGSVYRILLPGMGDARTVPLPFSRSGSNPRRSSGRGGGQRGSGPNHRGGKGREPSYSGEGSSSTPPPSRGGRGGYRGRGSENWSRRTTPTQAA
ncbi:hypothetical protein CABS01_04942 [Colletotrichum abscissum]|uniref:Uncharacterized protein n=1 Tax=Colletotrichum abscissum TaxID=1671311 RepID=A0A9Q0AY25_9PEZI|nr:uncharacterized protein CABS01_04942 [Colletotrichum abscissum]KAI3532489.1 hypothetical protein CABS02_13819 [Colletotrichum abscissum]KAK1472299.1 hypothetical protein CABS01_04942 [Colletotrichum abscissum]